MCVDLYIDLVSSKPIPVELPERIHHIRGYQSYAMLQTEAARPAAGWREIDLHTYDVTHTPPTPVL